MKIKLYENYLFTEQEYNLAHGNDNLPFKCIYCGKIFYKSKLYLQRYKGHLRWCCNDCKKHIKESDKHKNRILCICKQCGKNFWKWPHDVKKGYGQFCSCSCRTRFYNILKGPKYSNRDEYRNLLKEKNKSQRIAKRVCKFCGQSVCSRPEICKSSLVKTIGSKKDQNNLVKCGFDVTTLGSIKAYDEFDRIHDVIYDLYYNQNYSMNDIKKHFNIKRIQNVWSLLKVLNIPRRSFEETSLAYAKSHPDKRLAQRCGHGYQFKTGYHIDPKGVRVFYRSSYELDYMKYLDNCNISYVHEPFRVVYYNSAKKKETFCVPDFILPETNTIVEIKSTYTYDQQNMIDKSNQYKKLGYKFKLILDHKEYDYCP